MEGASCRQYSWPCGGNLGMQAVWVCGGGCPVQLQIGGCDASMELRKSSVLRCLVLWGAPQGCWGWGRRGPGQVN